MRAPLPHELTLLNVLIKNSGITLDTETIQVSPLNDSGMGSFGIVTGSKSRLFGRVASECHFIDSDNVPVLVALHLDQFDALFEVDVWKVDFNPVVQWPKESELVLGPVT
jgi:hypothetical protein